MRIAFQHFDLGDGGGHEVVEVIRRVHDRLVGDARCKRRAGRSALAGGRTGYGAFARDQKLKFRGRRGVHGERGAGRRREVIGDRRDLCGEDHGRGGGAIDLRGDHVRAGA